MEQALNERAHDHGGHPPPELQPPRALLRVIQTLDTFAERTGGLVSWLIVPLVGVMVFEVVARYFFDAPTIWAHDVSFMLYGAFFMLGAAYALEQKAHIRTDFLYNGFSVRWQAFVDTVAYVFFFFPGLAIFLWYGWDFFYDSWRLKEHAITSPWMPPLYPFKAVIPVTGALLLIQGVSETLKSIYALIRGRWL
jgi:TRAP-type mannitol/chloroaromatic compound transport system permease small subunit